MFRFLLSSVTVAFAAFPLYIIGHIYLYIVLPCKQERQIYRDILEESWGGTIEKLKSRWRNR